MMPENTSAPNSKRSIPTGPTPMLLDSSKASMQRFRNHFGCSKRFTGNLELDRNEVPGPLDRSDEAPADSLKEILGIRTRLFHHGWIVAMFNFRFLKCKLHGDLRFVPSFYEHTSTFDESAVNVVFCFRRGGRNARRSLTYVLT